MLAAQTIVELKKDGYKISLELALPFKNEYKPLKERLMFSIIEANSDKVYYVNEYYSKTCYIERNKYLVNNSSLIMAYYREYWDGAHYIIEYAKSSKKTIYAL